MLWNVCTARLLLSICIGRLTPLVFSFTRIRILDIILLVPNAIFLVFLFYGLSVAHTKFSRVRTPIVRTIYSLVCIIPY